MALGNVNKSRNLALGCIQAVLLPDNPRESGEYDLIGWI